MIRNNLFYLNEAFGNGGTIAIDKRSSVTVQNNVFTLSKAPKGKGGAIYAKDSNLVVDKNWAYAIALGRNHASYGGVIAIEDSSFSIRNNNFQENFALEDGGAIWIKKGKDNTRLKLSSNIDDNLFVKNRAEGKAGFGFGNGGAIYAEDSNFEVGCSAPKRVQRFTENWAKQNGGAIWFKNTNITKQPKFCSGIYHKNTASTGDGGALFFWDMKAGFQLSKSIFTQNLAASGKGGAIHIFASTKFAMTTLTIKQNDAKSGAGIAFRNLSDTTTPSLTDSTLDDNRASQHGGGIYLENVSIRLGGKFPTYKKNTISNNEGTQGGGGIYWNKHATSNAKAIKSEIINNDFLNNRTSGSGGGLRVQSVNNMVLEQNQINDNNAKLSGGGILFYVCDDITLRTNAFEKNQADGDLGKLIAGGGGIAWLSSAAKERNKSLLIQNNNFKDNRTASGGGGMFLEFAKATIHNNVFTENDAQGNGGAVYFSQWTSGLLIYLNHVFKNSGRNGGGFHFVGDKTMPKASLQGNLIEQNNAANGNGGGVFLADGEFAVMERRNGRVFQPSKFNKNLSKNNGGGMYTIAAKVEFERVHFVGNSIVGQGNGGGASFKDSALNIKETNTPGRKPWSTIFQSNSIQVKGNGAGLSLENSTLTNNASTRFLRNGTRNGMGGGLYLSKSSFQLKPTLPPTKQSPFGIQGQFIGNIAPTGGGIAIIGKYAKPGVHSIEGYVLCYHGNTLKGSAIYAEDATFSLLQSTLCSNTQKVTTDSSTIYLKNSQLTFERNLVTNNHDPSDKKKGIAIRCRNSATYQAKCNTYWQNGEKDLDGCQQGTNHQVLDPLYCNKKMCTTVQDNSPVFNIPACGRMGAYERGCKGTTSALSKPPVINEFRTNATGKDEFIEIYGGEDRDFSRMRLEARNVKGEITRTFTFPAGTSMPVDGFLVVAADKTFPNVDVVLADETFWKGAPASIHLIETDLATGKETVLDVVGYGSGLPSKQQEGSNPASHKHDTSVGRKLDGKDTNENGDDFTLCITTTPGTANTSKCDPSVKPPPPVEPSQEPGSTEVTEPAQDGGTTETVKEQAPQESPVDTASPEATKEKTPDASAGPEPVVETPLEAPTSTDSSPDNATTNESPIEGPPMGCAAGGCNANGTLPLSSMLWMIALCLFFAWRQRSWR